MNRKIKFKAWHSTKNKMFSAEQMGKDQLTLMPDGTGFINVSSTSTRLSQFMDWMIPLQFTGIQDVEGKEIYEGDILRTFDCEVGIVKFDTTFGVYGIQNEKHFRSFENIYITFNDIAPISQTIKIIGNIYENPELLKKE